MPSSRYTWSRPTTHIYSYNREAQNISMARSARASSVTEAATERSARTARATSAALQSFQGYTGFYGRQLALLGQKQASSASASSASASASSVTALASSTSLAASRTSTTQEKTVTSSQRSESTSVTNQREMSASLEYGRKSASRALRRAELHAASSGKDPRHTVLPRNVGDDICKVVADLYNCPYESKEITGARACTQQGRLKVERLEKELSRVTEAAMSYKSIYSKSAAQMAREAMEACDMEAASSKKVRTTVIEETSRKQVAAA